MRKMTMSSKISPIKEEEQQKPEKKHKLSFVQGFSDTVDEEGYAIDRHNRTQVHLRVQRENSGFHCSWTLVSLLSHDGMYVVICGTIRRQR